MFPAFLTTIFWSCSAILARHSVQQLGEDRSNLFRLVLAMVLLGILAHSFGGGLGGSGFWFFFLSGVVGFGLGDIGLYFALPRIGSRLTILIAQCGAAPVAGLVEWLWMGTAVSLLQVGCITTILCGITFALWPARSRWEALKSGPFLPGVAFAILAAVGQGVGVVLSRRAYQAGREAGEWTMETIQSVPVDAVWLGATAGYQRLVGGVVFILLFTWVRWYRGKLATRAPRAGDSMGRKAFFVTANAVMGPVLGIICLQWALATTPGVVVQPIIALTPIVIIPLAFWLEGDRPTQRSLIGGCLAVVGALLLTLV